MIGRDIGWVADPTLGGRERQFESLSNPELLSVNRIEFIAEMIYLSFLRDLGLFGLLAFLLLLSAPLLAFTLRGKPSRIVYACLAGCLIYCACAIFDGAYIYPPVMAFYWIVTSVALSCNPLIRSS